MCLPIFATPRLGRTLACGSAAGFGNQPIKVEYMVTSARPEKHPPRPHPSGARPPRLPVAALPGHVAIVMDGNGRWAGQRGLPRTRGHEAGEAVLFEVIEGASIGCKV